MSAGRHRSTAVIAIFLLACAVLSVLWRFMGTDGQAWRTVISGDAEGYYAYLEGTIVQGDLAGVRTADHHFAPAGEGRAIKYFCGTALLHAPFVLAAHGLCHLTGLPADGRSLPYAIAIALGTLCYAAFGLWNLRALLAGMGIGDGVAALTLAVIAFGTGLACYVVIFPGMSHVPGFAMIAWGFHAARRAWASPGPGALSITAIAMALTALVRPTDLLAFIALPVATLGREGSLGSWLRRAGARAIVPALGVFLALVALQPVLWYVQCGRFLVRPYGDEGFLWDRPVWWSLLFGARKGLFFYWPLLLLAVPGLWAMFRRHKLAAVSLIAALAASAYVIGCWWNWYYGWSYGSRPFIDLLPLFAVPIAVLFAAMGRRRVRWAAWAVLPFMALQCFQFWQYREGIIHPYNMDREKYRLVLLRTGAHWRWAFGGAGYVPPHAPHGMRELARWDHAEAPIVLDSLNALSPGLLLGPEGIPPGRPLYVEAELRARAVQRGTTSRAWLVCSSREGGEDRYHVSWPLNDVPLDDDRGWRPWRYRFIVPPLADGSELVCHVWLNGPGTMHLKDLRIRVSAPN